NLLDESNLLKNSLLAIKMHRHTHLLKIAYLVFLIHLILYIQAIAFQDINYQLALDEDRDLIFNQFANFLNSFDPSISIEFSYIN
ncbi:hypothetical protein ACTPEF_26510, partial [Clostridioides difficile]